MKTVLLLAAALVLAGCAASKYRSSNRDYKKQVKGFAKLLREYPVEDSAGLPYAPEWVGTTNFGMRRPNFVVIHHTAQNSCDQTLKTFTLARTQVSAHYVICRNGTVFHLLNDLLRAHHAGVGRWGNDTDINSSSIGIEIDNNGTEPFTAEQLASLDLLLGRLKRAYNIPVANFVGHSDIAPGRKVDPSKNFPWSDLAKNGYGLWYDTTAVQLPVDFNPMQALRIIGYDIRKPEAAIGSFKLHYLPQDTTRVIADAEKKILFSLQQQSQ
ncbi:MAG: N-acetylmuramoyl-L-alanine amidase [Chitinophagaceae bacterium]|nr:MAG: N-acetylmuramoyl-L-alanine amidase [Chitinophagaceae bacterium]